MVGSIFGDSFYDQQLTLRQTNALSHQVTKATKSNNDRKVFPPLYLTLSFCAKAGAVQHDREPHQLKQPLQPVLHPQLHTGGHDGPHREQLTGLAAARLQ